MTASNDILDCVERMMQAESLEDLRSILVGTLEHHGFQNIAYCSLSDFRRTGDPEALMRVLTFPEEWTRYYADRGYEEIDPVFHMGQVCNRPFSWQEVLRGQGFSERQREMIHEARSVGMAFGYTVPIFGPAGDHAVLSGAHMEKVQAGDRPTLIFQMLAHQFHTHYQRLCGAEPLPDPVHLAPREREVLLWVARGKTSWEIGQILNLATKSVDHYVECALKKLNAHNRIVGVVKAIYLGLITP